MESSQSLDDWRMFPLLYGNGKDGDVTISADTDGGCTGPFGPKQFANLTINAGVKLWAPPGSGNGGILFAVSGDLTINGAIIADGGPGATALLAGDSGKGGDGAGGPAGPAGTPTEANGTNGTQSLTALGSGPSGPSGALVTTNSLTRTGGAGVGLVVPATILPCYRADGLPYQQFSSSPTPGNMGATLARAWCKFAIVAGHSITGGNATSAASGISRALGGGSGGGAADIIIYANRIIFGASCAISAMGGAGGDGVTNGSTGWTGFLGSGAGGGRILIICDSYVGTPPNMDVRGGLNGRSSVAGTLTPSTQTTRGPSGEATFISLKGQE